MRILILAAILIAVALPLAADETPEMATVEGKHIILKVKADDLKLLDDPEAWVAKLDKAYEAYADLVGSVPYGGEKITILSVDEFPGGWAVAGNPILWWSKYIPRAFTEGTNKGDWSFGILHEISHDFDIDFGSRWAWELEFWANYKMDYVFPTIGACINSYDQVCDYSNPKSLRAVDMYLVQETKRGYGGRMLKGGWLDDSIHSKFTAITEMVGWDTYKRMFRWFNAQAIEDLPKDAFSKRSLFIRVLEEQSGINVSDQFIDWGFSHLTVDTETALEASRLMCVRDWSATIPERPIYVSPGEKITISTTVTEPVERRFEKGLGTHAKSEIIFDIGGKYKTFESEIGATGWEAAKNRAGSMIFEVVLDGRSAYKSPVLFGGGLQKSVKVDVSGVKELKLLVHDAGDGVNCDHAGWADAKVTDTNGKVTYLSDLEPTKAVQDWNRLWMDADMDGNPFMFCSSPCTRSVKIVGTVGLAHGQEIALKPGSEPGIYEYTFDRGFDKKGSYYVWLTINVGDSPITQHELVTIIVK